MALYHAQMSHELQDRANQLVGLQLFTKSLSAGQSLPQAMSATVAGIADLLGNVDVYLLVLRRQLPDDITLAPWLSAAFALAGSVRDQ